jgi:hypothetical protein
VLATPCCFTRSGGFQTAGRLAKTVGGLESALPWLAATFLPPLKVGQLARVSQLILAFDLRPWLSSNVAVTRVKERPGFQIRNNGRTKESRMVEISVRNQMVSNFLLGHSNLFRTSNFGFRVCDPYA